ncbi:MAG: 16S rRNA (uracil(1498)-N(3))-methyltransferase, partial [Lachnospiraceae bacterium]|nr:16S rRNA (uracil(1498)-N(3))-methyltransferase [Lachnospiraceae bacterium]
MYHFFAEPSQIQGTRIVITGNDVNHIKNVLRMKIGEEIAVSNGVDGKEYRCGIEEFKEGEIICGLRFIKEADVELPSKIYLFQGIPKSDKMEMIVQKAVELGVYEIIPVSAARSIVRFDEKKAKSRIIRWQGIAEAAAKQSRRAVIPEVKGVMSMRDALVYAESLDVK